MFTPETGKHNFGTSVQWSLTDTHTHTRATVPLTVNTEGSWLHKENVEPQEDTGRDCHRLQPDTVR